MWDLEVIMIRYYKEDCKFDLKGKALNNRWLKLVAESEIKKIGDINVIFCSDNYILDVNMKYLQHDYFTDIITFDYCEKNILSGDLFISIDSVKDNAEFYGVDFDEELNRVMVHGLLHLIGYDDHTESDIAMMRYKENYYLDIRKKLVAFGVRRNSYRRGTRGLRSCHGFLRTWVQNPSYLYGYSLFREDVL